MNEVYGSKDIAKAAVRLALTANREEEKALREELSFCGILSAAVDYGGEFDASISKIIERAVVSAKREGVIEESHNQEGAVAGAAHEALSQMMNKALGLNVGGKIAIARCDEHVSVAIFFGVGLLHLNEIVMAVGHRVI